MLSDWPKILSPVIPALKTRLLLKAKGIWILFFQHIKRIFPETQKAAPWKHLNRVCVLGGQGGFPPTTLIVFTVFHFAPPRTWLSLINIFHIPHHPHLYTANATLCTGGLSKITHHTLSKNRLVPKGWGKLWMLFKSVVPHTPVLTKVIYPILGWAVDSPVSKSRPRRSWDSSWIQMRSLIIVQWQGPSVAGVKLGHVPGVGGGVVGKASEHPQVSGAAQGPRRHCNQAWL